ncbi:MAG: N-acetyltransferase [Gemmatimonadetes bacterium]|nr:MAG: N-acetyltransferase [Gemmatimonadota bacterium]
MFKWQIDDHLELGLLEWRHAEELFAVVDANRAYLREWLPWVDGSKTVADSLDFIQRSAQQWADNRGFQACILFKGNIAGMIGFHRVDWQDHKCEIGYWLRADLQGQGIVTKCCQALVDFAFTEWQMNRVEIHCGAGNIKSQAIPVRLGFVQEGIQRQAAKLRDQFVDHVIFSQLRDEWSARR